MIDEGGAPGAGALLPPGKVIGRNELWVGVPARFERTCHPTNGRASILTFASMSKALRVSAQGCVP